MQDNDLSFVERFKVVKGDFEDDYVYYAVLKDKQLQVKLDQPLSYSDIKEHLTCRVDRIKEIVRVIMYQKGELSNCAVIHTKNPNVTNFESLKF